VQGETEGSDNPKTGRAASPKPWQQDMQSPASTSALPSVVKQIIGAPLAKLLITIDRESSEHNQTLIPLFAALLNGLAFIPISTTQLKLKVREW
jgi:peptidoglycan hydrolase-like protein with peptidoglycan-binding domain